MLLQRTSLLRPSLSHLKQIQMSAFSTSPTHSASDGKGDELFRAACVPCKGNSPAIPPSEYPSYLAQLSPEWRIEPFHGNTCPALQREFRFKNFKNAERLARTIGEIAEEPGVKHHPAIVIEWGKLTCAWWTHAISGLHKNDFICAAKTDKAANTARGLIRPEADATS